MKIAVFSDSWLPAVDGIVTSLEQLVLEYDRLGHQVLIIVPHAKHAPKKIGRAIVLCYLPSIPVLLHPTWHFGLISRKVLRLFNTFAPDVVQVATPANVGMMGIFLARQHKIPIVGVFHTYFMKPEYLQVVGIKRGTRFIESIGWKFIQFVFRPCAVVVSPSESVKQDLIAHQIAGRLEVCTNGIRIDMASLQREKYDRIVKKYKITPQRTFLYLGRLSREKNLHMLLKVFYRFHRNNPDVKLLLVGDGPLRTELEKQVRLYDMVDAVIFLGEVKHEDIFRFGVFQMARAFVTCSTSEVQPMSIIEALFFGLPIIGIRAQGMTDLVQEGLNGYLVSPNSLHGFATKMQTIIDNQSAYEQLTAGARTSAKAFSVEASAHAYLNVFSSLLGEEKTAVY